MSAASTKAQASHRRFAWGPVVVYSSAAAVTLFTALALQIISPAQQPAGSSTENGQQQPGQGAQVHTGIRSGLDVDARIESQLADHQYTLVAEELDQLPPEDAQLYRGILANRNNDVRQSIQLLEPLTSRMAASGDPVRETLLRKALAEDYLREGDLGNAERAYQDLETRGKLTADQSVEIEIPLKLLPLAASNPPATADPTGPFIMQVSRNPLGLTDVPVFVDAHPHHWMLDPTAPFNLIARSVAHAVGLRVSEYSATIRSLTGKPMTVHVTVIPRITIGGRLALHNVTAFVFEDSDYYFPNSRYQVEGVLGFPGVQAMGSVTITGNATVEVDPGDPQAGDSRPNSAQGARFYLDGDQVIVALGQPGQERMYAIDAAGQQSYLTSRFYAEHSDAFASAKMDPFSVLGAQNLPPQPAYTAETVPLDVGGNVVHAHYIQVLTQPLGSAALDDVYGVLGVDVLDQLRSYTFDYRTMRFKAVSE